MSSREQRLEAALREIADLAVPSPSKRMNAIRRIARDALFGRNADEHDECAQWRRWHAGECERFALGEQEATPPEPAWHVVEFVGDADSASLGWTVPGARLAFVVELPASAPQGEPEPSDDQPKVIESWLRWNDVECVRCRRMAGWEGERCYVVDEGVICDECTTDAEKARAVPQR